MDDLADKLGMDPLEFRLKNLGDRHDRRRSTGPDLRGRAHDGAELIGWEREAQAPRPERHRADQARAGHGPAPVGRRRPARTRRSPARSTPTARSSSRRATQDIGTGARTVLAIIAAEVLGLSRPTSSPTSATRRSRPARPRAARPRRRRWPRPATTPSPRPATRSSRRSRPALQRQARGPVAQGRPALGHGRAGDVLERRLPQARALMPISETGTFSAGPRPASASAAASSPRSPSTSRPAWSRSRRSSPSRTRA